MVSRVTAPGRVAAFIDASRAWCCFLTALGCLSAGLVNAQTAVPQLPPPAAPASASELREELQRLRQEFESIRDAYGARLAALESRLAPQTGAAVTPPAQSPATAPQAPATPQEVAVPGAERRPAFWPVSNISTCG